MGVASVLLLVLGAGLFPMWSTAYGATITTSLAFGSRGSEVTVLQTYLALDGELYPEKFITGYFGPLTEAAVKRFQCRLRIVCVETATGSGYGRVGPQTRARLNELLSGMTLTVPAGEVLGASTGNIGGIADLSAPIMGSEQTTIGSTFVTVSWTTNEPAWSRVLYSTTYPPVFSTSLSAKDPSFDATSGVTIGNLEPNTTYYYVRESVDVANNIAVGVTKSFTTSALGSALPGSTGSTIVSEAINTATSSNTTSTPLLATSTT